MKNTLLGGVLLAISISGCSTASTVARSGLGGGSFTLTELAKSIQSDLNKKSTANSKPASQTQGVTPKTSYKPLAPSTKSGADYFDLARPHIKSKNYAKAVPLLDKSCGLNYAEACSFLGGLYHRVGMYENISGVPKNISKTVQLYKKACDLNNAGGCMRYGYLYNKGIGVAQNKTKSEKLYDKACELGHRGACKLSPAHAKSNWVVNTLSNAMLNPSVGNDARMGEILDNKRTVNIGQGSSSSSPQCSNRVYTTRAPGTGRIVQTTRRVCN